MPSVTEENPHLVSHNVTLDLSSTWHLNQTSDVLKCVEGVILPYWSPLENVSQVEVAFRGIVYILILVYLFVGVSVIADKFMASIEMITSVKKEVEVTTPNGEKQTVVVRVWNETVANLTLMALGCSAPEILLSSIEIIGKNFEAGELGPGSTLGSAAFNLFVIIGVCNLAIPNGETRRVKHVTVFLVTAVWSIFAYFWLYIILTWSSHGVIEVWEAVVTFLFFPATVVSAYIADRYIIIYEFISKRYRMGRNGVIVEMAASDVEVVEQDHSQTDRHFKKFAEENENDEIREFEDHRRAFIILLKNLRRKYPSITLNQLEIMATKELLDRGTKSRAFYRILASRKLTGRSTRVRSEKDRTKLDFTGLFQDYHPATPSTPMRNIDRKITKVYFNPGHYTVMENVGELLATIVREDGDLDQEVLVDFATEDGQAVAGKDYEPIKGSLCFAPGETVKTLSIKVLDDNIYEEDQHFYIRLQNLRWGDSDSHPNPQGEISDDAYLTSATVRPELAPSYSTTEIEIEDDMPPPRYSVTAAEILRAIQTKKQSLAAQSEISDDVFLDASSHLDNEEGLNSRKPSAGQAVSTKDLVQVIIEPPTKFQDHSSAESSTSRSPHRLPAVVQNPEEEERRDQVPQQPVRLPKKFNPEQRRVSVKPHPSMLRLVCPSLATVMILDDDHQGIFSLTERSVCLTETVGTYNVRVMRCGGARGRVSVHYQTEEGTAKPNTDYQHVQGEIIFEDGETEKNVSVFIIENNSYEKDALFYFSIGQPKFLKDENDDSDSGINVNIDGMSLQDFNQLTESQRTALKGRAQLGEVSTVEIRIKESKEFKNKVDKIVKLANASLVLGTSTWKQQIIDAFHIEREENEEPESEPWKPTKKDYFIHALTVVWRVIFALVPPERLGGGYPCFIVSVVCIGIMTAIIGDVSSHLGCTVGLEDSVTAIAFVALGTSLPDLFASKVAAIHDHHADASISNVLGSNAVNVFLGIGVAWLLASVYHAYHGTVFYVEPGNMAFSVTLFCCMAFIGIGVMLLRRCKSVGGELGGPDKFKYPTSILFFFCWAMYILATSLEAYKYFTF